MIEILKTVETILYFIVVIGIIVFVHELGHFLAAKLSGVRVEVFSLGYPPKMFSKTVGETEYQLAWVPLGGYVKIYGMLDESLEEDIDPNDPRGFMAKPFLNKIFIISAGVIMNVILAFIIYTLLTWSSGISSLTGTTITYVDEDSPAHEVGIMEGDRIINIAGAEIDTWEDLTKTVQVYPGETIPISWERGDTVLSSTITPTATPNFNLDKARTDTVGKIGVLGTFVTEPVGPIRAIENGAAQVFWIIKLNIISVKALVTGGAHVRELTGPLGIAKLSGDSARSGVVNYLSFIGMISVSIGFLNILPIPMLDGGHLVFIVVETIIRRPIPDNIKINLIRAGMAALLLLIVVVSYNDILRFYFK